METSLNGSAQMPGHPAQQHQEEGDEETGHAADGGQRQGHAHGLEQEPEMAAGEEARDLMEDLDQHQKIFALTRKAQRPTSASDRLAISVSTT